MMVFIMNKEYGGHKAHDIPYSSPVNSFLQLVSKIAAKIVLNAKKGNGERIFFRLIWRKPKDYSFFDKSRGQS
ncbi:MAG: hypothetical protein R2828_06925 [Saprospiraceae bacterium]